MGGIVEYFFVPNSPWTWLGHQRMRDIARATGTSIDPVPFDRGQVFLLSGGLPLAKRAPQRQAYRLVELRRFREHLAMPLNLTPRYFPVNADLATRTDDEKLVNALRKSWNKMSAQGREAALGLALGDRERALVGRALQVER